VTLASPFRTLLFASCIAALAACTGGMKAVPSAVAGPGLYAMPAAAPANGKAVIVITVPPKTSSARVRVMLHGHPLYVSVATKGMTVAFSRGGKLVLKQTVALTPGSPGCSAASTGTQCRTTIVLKACNSKTNCYLANVSTFDAVKCSGRPPTCSIPARAHELSTEQKYPVGIFAGKNTNLTLVLAGIPVSASVIPADAVTAEKPSGAFDLIGAGAHALAVQFRDASGALIVGAGAPTLSISPVSGGLSPVTVTTPSSSPSEIYVTPPSTFDGLNAATFTVAPSYAGQAANGCKAPNANCTPIPVTVDMVQMVAIAGNPGVQLYALGSSTPLVTLQGGLTGLAADPAGNLYTGADLPLPPQEYGETLGVYGPPLVENAVPKSLAVGLVTLVPVADQSAYALLYVDSRFNSFYGTTLCSDAACTAGPGPSYLPGGPYASIAADAAGDSAISSTTGANCNVLIGASGPTVTTSNSPPCGQSMVFDASGNLFFTIPNAYGVVEVSKSSGYTMRTTISTGSSLPYNLAIDANGNLLCAGQDALTLDATLQETLSTTLAANQGSTVSPDHAIVIASPPAGQGTAIEALAVYSGSVYVQYSFLNGSSGTLAAYSLPGLAQTGSSLSNPTNAPTGLAILP
jgi:hypothetical protein